MSNNRDKRKDYKISLDVGSRYLIVDKVYEIIEVTNQHTYAVRVSPEGECYGRAITLGSLRNKKVEKVSLL
jgi:hypothetical protein